MTLKIEKSITYQLKVLYDHSVLTASLVTNISKLYNASCPLILAPMTIYVPSVNATTHFPSICGCKAESPNCNKNQRHTKKKFQHSYYTETKKKHRKMSFIYDKPSHFSTIDMIYGINPLNTALNPICHLLALLEAHHIVHVSRIRVNIFFYCALTG